MFLPSFQYNLNWIRRNITLEHPECLNFFQNFFFNETLKIKPIFHLHIPKTRGSSLCELARFNEFFKNEFTNQNFGDNCWHKRMAPYWVCGKPPKKIFGCTELAQVNAFFVGNERWMDYENDSVFCPSHKYLITTREIISHRMSHIENLKRFGHKDPSSDRFQIVSQNYFTWALLAGKEENPLKFRPNMTHLEEAKNILISFDFILDVKQNQAQCEKNILSLLNFKINTTMPFKNKNKNKKYVQKYNQTFLKQSNTLDLELYEFIKKLIKIDCEYFESVMKYKKTLSFQ
jgi:hypothetical protein